MLASLIRRPGYQQITEIPRFDVLKQVLVLLTKHAVLDAMNNNLSSANTFSTAWQQKRQASVGETTDNDAI